ncbi:hypothetical protein JTE90_017528 [Oedothorax gibbosus]|uniref:Prostamide/prostaglandin F synthase n=1 Tax=Oedothorax gibbosus TaxID=931172 RepID=A0AAV6UAB8_9ARAC|nr:hypothetical protein JTE90_017528 [Oedothorax gibbosus]
MHPLKYSLIVFGTIFIFISLSISAKTTKKSKTKECEPFPYASLDHGRITVSGSQKYTFHCDPGFLLASPRQVRCWRGRWSSTRQPKCIQAQGRCEDPPPIDGGTILGADREVGSQVQYICHENFMLLGNGVRTCLQSCHWSGVAPTCLDKKEPVQKVAERLRNKFVTEVGAHSTDSTQGRLLDSASLKLGLELVILVDRSSSVDPVDFKRGIDFIKFLLQQFGVKNGNNTSGTRAAVLAFGTNVDILFNLDNKTITSAAAASNALDTLQAGGGGTALQEALMSVFTQLPELRPGAKRALFVLTDGEPNVGSEEDTLFFARELRDERNFEIFTLGIGKGINRQFLAKLASEPAFNHIFVLDKYSNLMTVMQTIKDKKPKNRPISPSRCGYVKSEQDYLKTWPWLSAIYIGLPDPRNETKLSLCSGALICSQWILTAAACFYHLPGAGTEGAPIQPQLITSEVFPVLGEVDLINDDRNQINFYSEKVVVHPNFNPLNDLRDNLALVKLNAEAPMGIFRPVCLPPTDKTILLHQNLNTNVSIAGWGLAPSSGVDNRVISGGTEHFHVSNITVVLEDEGECHRLSGGPAKSSHLLCAGFGKQTCIGDLGSPIIAVDPTTNLHHVIGVLCSKKRCTKGINQYMEITNYIKWIDKHCAVSRRCFITDARKHHFSNSAVLLGSFTPPINIYTLKMEELQKAGENKIKPVASEEEVELKSLWADQDCVITFFRRWGCGFCRVAAKDMSSIKPKLDEKNVRLVGIGVEELGLEEFQSGNFFNGDLFIDADKKCYSDLGYKRYNILTIVPALVVKTSRDAISRVKAENLGGDMKGDKYQVGGTLVVSKGGEKILLNHKQESLADHVNPNEILKCLGIEGEVQLPSSEAPAACDASG